MDGDGHAKAFAWNEESDQDMAKPSKAFDPAAVLRAIDDEEDDFPDLDPVPKVDAEADLGSALRAALAYEETVDEDHSVEAEHETAGDRDRATDLEGAFRLRDESQYDDDHEDRLALADDHDEVEGWDDLHEDEEASPASRAEESALAGDEPEDAAPVAAAIPARRHPPIDELDGPGRKPRIALMGEFSAGKSTLSNLLIGSAPLPMKVTATQLPPVWISWGDGEPYCEDLHGRTRPIDITRLSDIDPAETRVIRIFAKSEILELCDIIDMPGISDPNMASDVWERVIGKADGVIWCTHATQAWRQSEAAVWESLDPKLFDRSLLLVTRFDKLQGETDRARVMRRVERETDGLFSARLPISLTQALAAGDDEELLGASGASAFRESLVGILGRLGRTLGSEVSPRRDDRTQETLVRDGLVARMEMGRPTRGITPSRILPRRLRPMSERAPEAVEHGGHDNAT